MQNRVEVTKQQECIHHWIIEPPSSTMSYGKCKRCGKVSEFNNSHNRNDFITHDKVPVKQPTSVIE